MPYNSKERDWEREESNRDSEKSKHKRRTRSTATKSKSTATTSKKGQLRKSHSVEQEKKKRGQQSKDEDTVKGQRRSSLTKGIAKMAERASTIMSESRRHSSMPVPDTKDRSSTPPIAASRTSLPYPSFSKAHSKEAVVPKDAVNYPRLNLYTPDPTDLDRDNADKATAGSAKVKADKAPPTPPLTTMDSALDDTAAAEKSDGSSNRKVAEEKRSQDTKEQKKERDEFRVRIKSKQSASSNESLAQKKDDDKQKQQQRLGSSHTPSKLSHKTSKSSGSAKLWSRDSGSSRKSTPSRQSKTRSPSPPFLATVQTESVPDSEATSIAPNQPRDYQEPIKTPVPVPVPVPVPMYDVRPSPDRPQASAFSPRPPPPPPPPQVPLQAPKVDYLLLNGGLNSSIPRSISSLAPAPDYETQDAPASALSNVFCPFSDLLDDYNKVMSKNGSLAVATGYRSVARRLLDRLEAVFARDISSEYCCCIICESLADEISLVDDSGVSWGEVLELVSGRRELPTWPAFVMESSPVGLGISSSLDAPMQKLDIDVPEEFRDHYVRQSQKTKKAVDRWLADQCTAPTSAPDEVDDDTLNFAILTHLPQDKRQIYSGLLGSLPTPNGSRSATPIARGRPESLVQAGLAIQRLYRLSALPRDQEVAIYLLNNPAIHNILATLAAISDDEWEILVSGRFDGFLRSGAEDGFVEPVNPMIERVSSRAGISRTGTPAFRPGTAASQRSVATSYGTAPAAGSFGAPIALDEETEIAVLAEVERQIYLGMEALEDAFEALHCKAETVRRALRERGAGLSMAAQIRRGYSNVSARLGTPSEAGGCGWDGETDDGLGDLLTEIAPDDSASNISSNRHRRPKRRTERRTPVLLEEEEGDAEDVAARHHRHHRGSRLK